jgi:phosphohistidine phosphatase SixA
MFWQLLTSWIHSLAFCSDAVVTSDTKRAIETAKLLHSSPRIVTLADLAPCHTQESYAQRWSRQGATSLGWGDRLIDTVERVGVHAYA